MHRSLRTAAAHRGAWAAACMHRSLHQDDSWGRHPQPLAQGQKLVVLRALQLKAAAAVHVGWLQDADTTAQSERRPTRCAVAGEANPSCIHASSCGGVQRQMAPPPGAALQLLSPAAAPPVVCRRRRTPRQGERSRGMRTESTEAGCRSSSSGEPKRSQARRRTQGGGAVT
jgi:hypothetical protein